MYGIEFDHKYNHCLQMKEYHNDPTTHCKGNH